jgi:Ser/Thr protein kinase RdoA (MazF antagonist)
LLTRLHWVGRVWKRQRPDRPAFTDLDLETNAWWDLRVVEMPPALEQAYERSCAWLAAAPWLARGAVHGDVYRGNFRVRERRIHGVVDWEDARIDWPAWELANATWEICKDEAHDRLDPERSARFLDAYSEADGPGELGPFDELLRLRLVADALYSLTSAARDEAWDPQYVEHLLRALQQLDD